MRQYVTDVNTLESERYQREVASDNERNARWQAAAAAAAAPFTGGASLMMMPSGSVGGGVNLSGASGMYNQMNAMPNTQTLGNQQLFQGNPYSGGTMYGANQYAQQNPFKFVGM